MSKFKIGDKVIILDGSNIPNYTHSWVEAMGIHIGEVVTVSYVGMMSGNRFYYNFEEIGCSWDERGLMPYLEAQPCGIFCGGLLDFNGV